MLISCKAIGVNAIVEYFGHEDKISGSILSASGSLVDGVIVFYESQDDRRIAYLKNNHVPFIVFGKSKSPDIVYVSNNDYDALYHLMGNLASKGHQKIWMLMGEKTLVNLERARGMEEWIAKQPASEIKLDIFYHLITIESVYDFVSKKLTVENHPDAIFVSGDEKFQGLIRACYEKSIQIPDDLAIVGFDNIPISQYYTPALSTIAPDYLELSKQLLERLLCLIKGEKTESVEVATTFLPRSSS